MPDEVRGGPTLRWKLLSGVLGIALLVLLIVWWFSGPSVSSSPTTAPTEIGSLPAGESAELLAVVVDNAPAAHPLVGIADSPFTIEYPVEGGLTRFLAVVHSGSGGMLGPVRSLRPVNADLAPALTSALVSSGGQSFVVQEVTASGVTVVTPDIGLGFVSMGRSAPHDVFVDLDELAELFAPQSIAPGFPSGTLPSSDTGAETVSLPFAGVSLVYEEGVGYARHQDGAPVAVLDREGGAETPLAHDTLVVLFAAERSAGYSDSNGAPVATFDVIGGGELMVFGEGRLVTGRWSRDALEDPYVFRADDGSAFGIPDGRTYIAVVPRTAEVGTG